MDSQKNHGQALDNYFQPNDSNMMSKQDKQDKQEEWDERRYRIAMDIFPGMLESTLNAFKNGQIPRTAGKPLSQYVAERVVEYTDALIAALDSSQKGFQRPGGNPPDDGAQRKIDRKSDDMASNAKEVMTTEEVAKYMGVSKGTIYKLTMTRKIPYYKPTGRMCYFKRSELEAWLLSNRVSTDEEIEQQAMAYCLRKGRGR